MGIIIGEAVESREIRRKFIIVANGFNCPMRGYSDSLQAIFRQIDAYLDTFPALRLQSIFCEARKEGEAYEATVVFRESDSEKSPYELKKNIPGTANDG